MVADNNSEFGLELNYKYTDPSGVDVTNSKFSKNGLDGVYVQSGTINGQDLVIADNSRHGYNNAESGAVVTNSTIVGNEDVQVTGGDGEFTTNWWGAADGPTESVDYENGTEVNPYCTETC